jgi:hypothetical protein
MSETVAPVNEHSYDALTDQLAYRRDRRHAVFAWSSSILVAIIGGLVAFTPDKSQDLNSHKQWIITATIGVLAVFTLRCEALCLCFR